MEGKAARRAADWKRYPFVLAPDDAQLIFPAAEGDQGAESNTYYVAGRLRGRASGREWAFLTVFTFNDIHHRLRADFYTLALFDLGAGTYGTFSEFDLPRPFRLRRRYKLSVAPGHLDVAFDAAPGRSSWTTRRAADGTLQPFAYHVSLHGTDADRRRMHLELDIDTLKPPMPVGGAEYAGTKTCIGQYGTHSYFQSDLRFSGTLAWGDTREAVDGDCGWIDRQWTPRHLGVHNDSRSARYRHEWRQLHLDNGMALSAWMNIDRPRHNRPIPFWGVTLATADGRVLCTTEYELERTSFVRDPEHVRPTRPLTRGAKWMSDGYRLRVPAWELELSSTPLVPAPAHLFPIEYWSGPTRIEGRLGEQPLSGFGFHERTMIFARDFELVEVLRQTLRHLPAAALAAGGPSGLALANLAWEVDGFLSHHGRAAARAHLRERVRPQCERLAAPQRAHVLQIVADLDAALR
ncbi:MAG: lipocalin-like domain-containing protein [Deltaproteobacteria bacterium]|nr:lipocalin-like domain-containing protein [Deltaproteobacteria bacterium]